MIRTPTVLVLGAGASMPYGFPSGQGLKENIISFGAEVHKRIEHLPRCTQERFQEFQRELRYSSQSSVDAFLEHRPELVPLGKALIALAWIPTGGN